jgi:cell division septation protein DedD
MPDPNSRVRARGKFQLTLDGRQAASVVVGALVVFAAAFFLGLNVGRQVAVRQLEGRRAGDLEALDRAPAAPPAKAEPLTFHDRLTKESPAPPPPPEPPPRADVPAAPAPAPAAPAAVAPPAVAPAPAVPEAAAPPPRPEPAPLRPWTVQLAASEDRAEAERLAARFVALNPRVEEAVIPGKGRFFRVRVGSFETKEAAQRYLRDVGRETGAKGIVAPSR